MKIATTSPWVNARGTYKTTDLVFSQLGGETVARAKVTPANPRSGDQLKVRSYLTLATRNWDTLTVAQRSAWQSYAEQHFASEHRAAGIKGLGLSIYVRANAIRQMLGLAMVADAPVEGPPVSATGLRQLGGQDPDSLGFELDHGIVVPAGYQVVARMTPAMPTVARTPQLADYRHVCGVSSASSQPLQASGGSYLFGPTRFIVDGSRRYGVEVRIVRTADGIAGEPIYGDFLKEI